MRKSRFLMLASVVCLPLAINSGLSGASEPVLANSNGPTSAVPASGTIFPPSRQIEKNTNLYWGDVHVHTSYSPDAYVNGNISVTPDIAYRFARGEEVTAQTGLKAKLRRPLDFLAVTDHAAYMGVHARIDAGDRALADWHIAKRWSDLRAKGDRTAYLTDVLKTLLAARPEDALPESINRSIWEDVVASADRYNEPGRFTALIGYEWSSTVSGDNLHRNVLFRGDAKDVAGTLPFTSQDSNDPEKLWAFLEQYEARTGKKVLAIPHNANLSNGRMFAPTMADGKPFTSDYARKRVRWEPVVEVTQIKGDGEAHPSLFPTDEFADFENWDSTNLMGTKPKQPWMLQYEYARSVLGLGLGHEKNLGANPFKFGMIGSTDTHTGLATTTEDNFFGKFASSEPSAERALKTMGGLGPKNSTLSASGLTAVWARENTREAIFDAIARREVYGTTGSRIRVRFFGGWNFGKEDVERPDFAEIGYAKGVPMGGDLMKRSKSEAPRFMVLATKDPDGANLDRIQIIKGWLGKDGTVRNKIYDVALSDGRKVDRRTGKAPSVGSTVDVANATYTNSIGEVQLARVWTDPDFDPELRAFYYVRVIEIPTPRWTAYDAKYFGTKIPKGVPMVIQDRAYTSPIWYTP